MTNEKQNIIDAEFSETETSSDTDEQSLIVPKQPGKPANSRNTDDSTNTGSYLWLATYMITALFVLAITVLYLRGMAIAA
jgi:hypothetical protein